jgi:uncharacterized protein
MLLSLEPLQPEIGIRACAPDRVLFTSGKERRSSFYLGRSVGVIDWPVARCDELCAADLDALFALTPDVILLGTGNRQQFPSAAVIAAALSRRIGLEVMDNAAAARTYNVLSGEGRQVLLAMLMGAPTTLAAS